MDTVSLTFIFFRSSLEDYVRGVVTLPRAEHSAEDRQCAREEPGSGGWLLCERLLGGTQLFSAGVGTVACAALSAFWRLGFL